ncbi:bifunctional riboflavin kinase/FAD synthetase [Salinibacter ruber]|uniref:bifunctional riboflavin kinase/FAD synthetase n=1 Tax=Salinibacter ruber TaxID=146919 RepID=UPI00216971EA|nr:bifunctional riboflavin kinase/FAD synthetase [Salinibacter ruber]MCS3640164.1 riboflavin kinase/FMN adenylyltransferase [Salinibacter ruber]
MKREIGWDAISRDPQSVVTVGTFDGVHRGHQAIIEYLQDRAEAQNGPSTLVSFDPHPRAVVHDEEVPLLTTVAERADLLERLGLDRFVVVPFSDDFAQLSPTAYVEEVLVDRIGVQEITVGYDHRFGKDRAGDVEALREFGGEYGFSVDVIPPQEVDHDVVSSRTIRSLLVEEGRVEQATDRLGRPYQLQGVVSRGQGRGRKLGYPTANLALGDARKLVPKQGVYATAVTLPNGDRRGGMMNIGSRPTFDEMDVTVEVHLLDYEGNLYGASLSVEFLQRLRAEQKFESAEALAAQLSEDEERCRTVIRTQA